MAGLKGMSRLPKSSQRERRNAAVFQSNLNLVLGDGLEIGDDGLFTVVVQDPVILDTSGVGLSYGTGLQVVGSDLTTKDSEIDHDALANFLDAEHIDWTDTTEDLLTTGSGAFGTLAANVVVIPDATAYNDYTHALQIGTTDPLYFLAAPTNYAWLWYPSTGLRIYPRAGSMPIAIQHNVVAGYSLIVARSVSSGDGTASWFTAQTSGSGNKTHVRGFQNTVAMTGTGGTISSLIASNTSAQIVSSAESASEFIAGKFQIRGISGKTGSVGLGYGLDVEVIVEDAAITTCYGLRCETPTVAGGSLGTYAHLWLDNATVAGTNYAIVIDSDSIGLVLGAGQDLLFYYNGTSGVIDSSLVAPSDLHVACGTDKTLVLDETVWKDANLGGAVLSASDAAMSRDEFVDNTGTDTGIETWALGVDDGVQGSLEIPHDYAEGTDLYFHVHWQGIAAPTGTDKVQWQLTYVVAREGVTLSAVSTLTVETDIDTQYEFSRSDFAAITGTDFEVGDQFLFRLDRISASADEYGGDALLATVGIHYQIDTLGSRQLSTK